MTSIRKLALALCLAGSFSFSNAVADTSGELINNNGWSGATYGADPGGCCASISGSGPLYDTLTGTIMYSYGQSTISQTIGLQQALGGTGVQVNGYNYSWDWRLISNNGTANDNLTANISLRDAQGIVVQSRDFTYTGAAHDVWNTESGTTTFANPYTDPQSLTLSFSGRDGGFWAGYYGPELRNISLTVNYTFDPCAADPLYSPTCPGYAEAYKNLMCNNNPLYDQTCPGYSSVVASGNLVPYPGSNAGYLGSTFNNSFAINTALSHSGAGVMIHGFQWGYRAVNYNGVFGLGDGSSTVSINIRDSQNNSLHAWSRNNTTIGSVNYSGSYVFPQSQNQFSLGTFQYNVSTSGFGTVDSMWARALYTPDSCSLDPLVSPQCSKYEEAFLALQCSITPLYSPSCPGYAEAMAEMLAASMPTSADPAESYDSPVMVAQASTPTTIADDTKDPTEVATDVGGVELTTTGEIRVADPVPAAAKESAKETTKEEKKSLGKDQLRAIADRAVKETEKTALTAADAAVEQSQSAAANPEDGTGATVDLGGGLSLRGLLSLTGQLQAGPSTLPDRTTEDDRARSQSISQAADALQSVIDSTVNTAVVEDEIADKETANKDTEATDLAEMSVTPEVPAEPQAPTGPAVRRGGKVEGMEGGADIDSLAAAPADFNDYLSQQLQDAQFYASKDIYRGQVNVDNARALRGLGTDRLHQQMVDQQYNQGR